MVPSLTNMPTQVRSRIRIAIQQPGLPKYRVPFFRHLAAMPDFDMRLVYGSVDGIPQENVSGFKASYCPLKKVCFGGQTFLWHYIQLDCVAGGEFDVSVLSWDLHYLTLIPALLKARARRYPVVLWGHGFSKREGRLRRSARNALARMASAVIVYNHTAADALIRDGIPAKRVFVALNTLDFSEATRAQEHWGAPSRLRVFQEEHGLVDTEPLAYIGRIYPENRLELLIQALPELVGRRPAVRVLVIGKVNQDAERLQALATSLGVSEKIVWAGALYDEMQIAPWLMSSALFCYPTNVGLSLLHAFAYGLPAVLGSGRSRHNPEIEALIEGTNGLFFEHGKPDALAQQVLSLLEDPARRASMAEAARKTAYTEFRMEKMVEGYADAIRFAAANP